jgi:hypothetical protein
VTNFNDAKITSLYVSATSAAGIQDDAPNAPGGGNFDVTLEMVAGGGLTGPYTLITTCGNVSDTGPAAALNPGAPLNGPANFAAAPWTGGPTTFVFDQTVTITLAAGAGGGKVYRYTASLLSSNGQIVSTMQSDLFTLL